MSLRVILQMKAFLFERERMWKVRINADGPTWHVRRLTQQEAVAQAAGMQWGGGDYKITRIPGIDTFAIEVKHARNAYRPLGVATCTPA